MIIRYILAIFLPPVAVFLCGKPIQGIINIFLLVGGFMILTVPGALVAVVHALFVVHSHHSDKQTKKIIKAINKKGQ